LTSKPNYQLVGNNIIFISTTLSIRPIIYRWIHTPIIRGRHLDTSIVEEVHVWHSAGTIEYHSDHHSRSNALLIFADEVSNNNPICIFQLVSKSLLSDGKRSISFNILELLHITCLDPLVLLKWNDTGTIILFWQDRTLAIILWLILIKYLHNNNNQSWIIRKIVIHKESNTSQVWNLSTTQHVHLKNTCINIKQRTELQQNPQKP